jgi:hypothetical protein
MKQIQPVNIWSNGQQNEANAFGLSVINDDLKSSATFYYQLYNVTIIDEIESIINLSQGNLVIDGEDYINWSTVPDINESAYIWATEKLNLVLVVVA